MPGPIHTANWIRSIEHAKLRDLYPVIFQQRLTLLDDGHYGGEAALPLEFERAGRDARFLWLANDAEESELAWATFPGVFGYYAVKSEKPGATVYARVADPEAGLATSCRCTSPASSTAPARCSTSAVANSGGCGRSIPPTSRCSSRSWCGT